MGGEEVRGSDHLVLSLLSARPLRSPKEGGPRGLTVRRAHQLSPGTACPSALAAPDTGSLSPGRACREGCLPPPASPGHGGAAVLQEGPHHEDDAGVFER